MDLAIVTGANELIGTKISHQLIEMGFKVFGLAQDFSNCKFIHKDFVPIPCDLTSLERLEEAVDVIKKEKGNLFLLVNTAQRITINALEGTALDEIDYAVKTGLLAPIALTKLMLPDLIQYRGNIINIAWNGKDNPSGGALEAAIQSGLITFGKAIFDEVRDTGVKVCNMQIEENKPSDDANQIASAEPQSTIDPSFVAEAIQNILRLKENNLIHDLVIRPQGTREEPRIPFAVAPLIKAPNRIILPPKGYEPVEPESIPTPDPMRPQDWSPSDREAFEEDDDDELDKLIESTKRNLTERNQQRHNQNRSSRRRGRNNNRNRRNNSQRSTNQNHSQHPEQNKEATANNDKNKPETDSKNKPNPKHKQTQNGKQNSSPRTENKKIDKENQSIDAAQKQDPNFRNSGKKESRNNKKKSGSIPTTHLSTGTENNEPNHSPQNTPQVELKKTIKKAKKPREEKAVDSLIEKPPAKKATTPAPKKTPAKKKAAKKKTGVRKKAAQKKVNQETAKPD